VRTQGRLTKHKLTHSGAAKAGVDLDPARVSLESPFQLFGIGEAAPNTNSRL